MLYLYQIQNSNRIDVPYLQILFHNFFNYLFSTDRALNLLLINLDKLFFFGMSFPFFIKFIELSMFLNKLKLTQSPSTSSVHHYFSFFCSSTFCSSNSDKCIFQTLKTLWIETYFFLK